MRSFLILIPPDTRNKEALLWLFKTGVLSLNLKQVKVNEKEIPGYETIRCENADFYSGISELKFTQQPIDKDLFNFNYQGIVLTNGVEDELLTAFYLINCIQEYNNQNSDAIGRFKYENSYQEKFGVIETNLVRDLFLRYFKKYFPQILENEIREKTSFFFSHDIDSLYGAFLQDGLAALKNGRFDIITRLIFNTVLLRPDWFNIDKILKIENEYDLRSTFFWIVNKGRVSKTLTNADYAIQSKEIQTTLKSIEENGNIIGLHKSISDQSFAEEIKMLTRETTINRNHYLRFNLPDHFEKVESSPLKIDCSLGFAEHYGFRNSLAIPFVPFNLKKNQPYNFLEVPLNVMDGTFQKYMHLTPEETSRRIIEFIEKNSFNSVISVLWHNHFFSSYRFRGYFEPYKELLSYLKEQKFSFINPDQLVSKYTLT